MIGGKNWLEVAVVTAVALGFVTLLLVIRAQDRGRAGREIVRTAVLVWSAAIVTLLLAWQLEIRLGGPVFDVNVGASPGVVARDLDTGQVVMLGAVLLVMVALYVVTILAVRRLIEPEDGPPPLQVHDGGPDGGRE